MCQLAAYPPIMQTPVTPPEVSPLSAEPTTSAAFSQAQYSRAGDFALTLGTLPDASNFLLKTALKSPHLSLDSPSCFSFSPTSSTFLNGSGNYKKRSRNMSTTSSSERDLQSSVDAQQATPQQSSYLNGSANGASDLQSSNAKKRPSDGTIDYPRRRATIAVMLHSASVLHDPSFTDMPSSAKSAVHASLAATATAQSAGSAPSSMPSVYTASRASSSMPATS